MKTSATKRSNAHLPEPREVRAGGWIEWLQHHWSLLLVFAAVAAQGQVLGDVNCDGRVTDADLPALVDTIFTSAACPDSDVNHDGRVDGADIIAIMPLLLPAPTPVPVGPVVTFLGLAAADGVGAKPLGDLNGVPVYARGVGAGFQIVVEGAPGLSSEHVGLTIFDRNLTNPTHRPDLQIESNRPLGDGSLAVCDGGVPAVDPPDFGPSQFVANALNDLACYALVATARSAACTLDSFARSNFLGNNTQVQFCIPVLSTFAFAAGDTVLTVRLRDTAGNLGPIAQVIVRVNSGPIPPTFTPSVTALPSHSPTLTSTIRPTSTVTLTPSPTFSATRALATSTSTRVSATISSTPNSTPTASSSPRPSATLSPTGTSVPTGSPGGSTTTPTRTPTRSITPSATLHATTTPTISPSSSPGSVTSTARPSATPSATASRTATATGGALTTPPTRTPTPSSTLTPTRTASPSPTGTPSRTPTRLASPTPSVSPTRTAKPTSTPSRTAAGPVGPFITFFGITRADDTLIDSIGTTTQGIPIYPHLSGDGFSLVVEGKPGASLQPVGSSAYDPDVTSLPDLQIEVSQPLGNASSMVCDRLAPAGGVPAIDPPNFDPTQNIINTVNDLACRFLDGAGNPVGRGGDACVLFPSGEFHFVNPQTTLQFCGFIDRPLEFQPGDTLVTVQLRDTDGNLGPSAQIVVRVGSQ